MGAAARLRARGLALGGAYACLKDDARAEEQYRLALKRDGDDFAALVAVAALLLRRAADAATLKEARALLARAEPLVGQDAGRQHDWQLNQAVYLGLTGASNDARALLLTLMIRHSNDDAIRTALKALGD